VTGRHAEGKLSRRTVIIIAVTAVVGALGAGTAVAFSMRSDDPKSRPAAASTPSVDPSREAAERAARDAERSESPAPPASESPSASPSPSATRSPSPSRKPSPSRTTEAGGGNVTSSGSCGASYYDTGSRTANGEAFDPDGITAAHKTLPFNTKVRVTNKANGKSVTVRINDRGPFVGGRCLDLSRGAFKEIASLSAGVLTVDYQVLG